MMRLVEYIKGIELNKLHKRLVSHYKDVDHHSAASQYTDSPSKTNLDNLDRELHSHSTPFAMSVYSGTRTNIHSIAPSKDGYRRLTHVGVTSTSIDHRIAKGFTQSHTEDEHNNHEHVLHIHLPKGHPGAYVAHVSKAHSLDDIPLEVNEKEFVLPRGTKLKLHPKPVTTTHTSHMPSGDYHNHTHTWHATVEK